jgi:hypothetical protein
MKALGCNDGSDPLYRKEPEPPVFRAYGPEVVDNEDGVVVDHSLHNWAHVPGSSSSGGGRARGRALRSQALLGLFEEPYGRARRGQGLARLRHLRQQQPEGERSPREKARASRQKARGFSAGGTTPCRRPAWPGKPATRLARRRLNPPPGFSSRGGTAREGPQKGLTGSREREDQASIGLCSSAFPGKATLQTLDFHPGSS